MSHQIHQTQQFCQCCKENVPHTGHTIVIEARWAHAERTCQSKGVVTTNLGEPVHRLLCGRQILRYIRSLRAIKQFAVRNTRRVISAAAVSAKDVCLTINDIKVHYCRYCKYCRLVVVNIVYLKTTVSCMLHDTIYSHTYSWCRKRLLFISSLQSALHPSPSSAYSPFLVLYLLDTHIAC